MGRMKKNGIPIVEAVLESKKNIWYVPIYGNYVCRYLIEKNSIEVVCRITEEPKEGFRLFSKIVDFDESIFLIPLNAQNLYKVNKYSGNYEIIEIEDFANEKKQYRFGDGYRYDDSIILVCTTYKGLVIYDNKLKRIEYVNQWPTSCCNDNENEIFFRKSCLYKGTLFAPFYQRKKLLEYRIFDNELLVHDISTNSRGFSGCCASEKMIWLLSCDGFTITEYERGTSRSRDIINIENIGGKYADIIRKDIFLYCLPLTAKKIVEYNTENGCMKFIGLDCEGWSVFSGAEDGVSVSNVGDGNCFRFEDETIVKTYELDYPKEYYVDMTKKHINENGCIYENDDIRLESFVIAITK